MKKSKADLYHDATCPLMVFVHNREFAPGHDWTNSEKLAVTPELIVRYLKTMVYGNKNAQLDVDRPIHYQSNTVLYWKKAWSYFMLNKILAWNEVALTGNPTHSRSVLELFITLQLKKLGNLITT
jgi:hypothetical protein